jgi:hypothetical protein
MRDHRAIDKEPTVVYDQYSLRPVPRLRKVHLEKSANDCDGHAHCSDSD